MEEDRDVLGVAMDWRGATAAILSAALSIKLKEAKKMLRRCWKKGLLERAWARGGLHVYFVTKRGMELLRSGGIRW